MVKKIKLKSVVENVKDVFVKKEEVKIEEKEVEVKPVVKEELIKVKVKDEIKTVQKEVEKLCTWHGCQNQPQKLEQLKQFEFRCPKCLRGYVFNNPNVFRSNSKRRE